MSVPAFVPAAPPPQPSSASAGGSSAAAQADGPPTGFEAVLAAIGGKGQDNGQAPAAAPSKDAGKTGKTASATDKVADDAPKSADDASATPTPATATPDAVLAMLLPTATTTAAAQPAAPTATGAVDGGATAAAAAPTLPGGDKANRSAVATAVLTKLFGETAGDDGDAEQGHGATPGAVSAVATAAAKAQNAAATAAPGLAKTDTAPAALRMSMPERVHPGAIVPRHEVSHSFESVHHPRPDRTSDRRTRIYHTHPLPTRSLTRHAEAVTAITLTILAGDPQS